MKKILLIILCFLVCGCRNVTRHEYRFETIDDAFLCVDNQFTEEYNPFTKEYTEIDFEGKFIMETYDNCIAQLPYPPNFIEKEKEGTKICYDKNNKIELPVLYCQKDHNVMVNVVNDINMSQTSVMKNNTYF